MTGRAPGPAARRPALPAGFTGLGGAGSAGAALLVAGCWCWLRRTSRRDAGLRRPGAARARRSSSPRRCSAACGSPLPGAVAGALLLNWFLTPPYGTLVVDSGEQVVVLAVYLGVAVAVSWVVDLAARRTAEAARARAEAEALSGAGRGRPRRAPDRCPTLLAQVRAGVRDARGRAARAGRRRLGRWSRPAARARPAADERELRVPAGDDLLLRVRGPELFAADRRVLASFADAAAGALEGRRLAERAAEAAQLEAADRMRTALLAGVGHDLRTPLARSRRR